MVISGSILHPVQLPLFMFATQAAHVLKGVVPLLNRLQRPLYERWHSQHETKNSVALLLIFGVVSNVAQQRVYRSISRVHAVLSVYKRGRYV